MNGANYFAVDTASVGFAHIKIITDSSGEPYDIEFLHTNPAFNQILGKKPSFYTDNRARSLTQDREKIEEILESATALKDGIELNFDQYIEKTQKWIRVQLSPQEKGCFFAWIKDITNQVYYEQLLKDSEERFREIFNNAHDAIYIHKIVESGMPGKFIMANREALKRLGYTLRELKQMTPADIDSNRKQLNIPHIMEEIFKNEEYVFRGEHVTKSGKVIPVENKVHLFTLKGEKMIISISRDITEELSAQEKQRQDKALLQSVLDALPGKLRVIDRNYQVIAANDELLADAPPDMKTTEDLKGHCCYQLFYGKDKPCKDCNLKSLEELTETETKIYYKDEDGIKDKKAFKLFLAPLKNENGEKIGIIEYSVEITELKNAQRNAEKASRAKTEFMMNMSHELRTPLNGIIGFSAILEESVLNESQKEFVRNIQVSGKALLNIVSDILNYSKLESKKVTLKTEITNLRQLMTNTFNGIQEIADNKGLKTQLSIDENIPPVIYTDPLKLSQVLTNLLMNAVKFTDEGCISCKAQLLKQANGTVDILFSVSDTGIGIADSMQEKIFESFSQADSSLARKYGGTGLGLTISSNLLHMMGSSIKLESELGKGSIFSFIITFDLPKETGKAMQTEENAYHTDLDTRSYKILVVEDNVINLKLNKMVIKKHFPDAGIFTAEDGKKAVEAFIQHRPDIILMDIRMPNMNGFEATEKIRMIEGKNWKTKIIAISADARTENIQYGMLSGLDGYITKPVDPEEMIEEIEKIIKKGENIV